MAKQNTAPTVKKVNPREVKRTQDKDDLETLEEKASHPVSIDMDKLKNNDLIDRLFFFLQIGKL